MTGYEQDTKIQQGCGGTAIELDSTQYFQHTAGGLTVDPVATGTVYRNTDGTGGETTSLLVHLVHRHATQHAVGDGDRADHIARRKMAPAPLTSTPLSSTRLEGPSGPKTPMDL